ncbi:MAG TPA: TldD/PmbA family protein [Candidatus Binatus sp.]|nr:TldD/PmbA family protein [Candidatus Binatus sp.]
MESSSGSANKLREQAHQIFDWVKGFAKGAEVEVGLGTNVNEGLRFGNNELSQSQYSRGKALSVRVVVDKRQARSTTRRLERTEVEKTVQKALAQAKAGPEDPDLLPMLGPQKYPSVDRYFNRTADAPAEEKAAWIGHAIDLAKKNGLLASGILETNVDQYWMLTSAGLEASYRGTQGYYSLTMDADNGNQTGYALSTFTDLRELDANKVADSALERAKLNKNQGDISPGKYDVVIDPQAWSETLFFLIVSASSGYTPDFGVRQYKEGRSYLSGRMGEKIMGDNISIDDDAYHPMQTGAPFDGEGYPKSKLNLVENGVLKNLASSRISAHKYKDVKATGHELPLPNPLGEIPNNLVVRAKGTVKKSADDLVKELDKGLFITRLWYIREVEPRQKTVTGMTRDGTFLVENGEIKRPVKNVRYNESLLELLSKVEATSEPVRNLGRFGETTMIHPGVLARDFNVTSISVF